MPSDHDSTEELDPEDEDWVIEPPPLRLHLPIGIALGASLAYYIWTIAYRYLPVLVH